MEIITLRVSNGSINSKKGLLSRPPKNNKRQPNFKSLVTKSKKDNYVFDLVFGDFFKPKTMYPNGVKGLL